MRRKTLFKLNYKIKGIVLTSMDGFVDGNNIYTKYLCYTEDNKLFTLTEEIVTYPENKENESYTVTSYHMGEVLSNNTIISEFDNLLKNDNIYYLGIDLR